MGKAVLDISMSLDGVITRPNDTAQQPLGERGEHLGDWGADATDDTRQGPPTTGAIIVGRRTHPVQAPVFVLTHRLPERVPAGVTPFTFVTGGLVDALVEARAVARGKDVYVMGGAHVAQQYLRSGLLDEMVIHLVPLLLGDGIRLFDNLGPDQIQLVQTQVTSAPEVVHLRYRFRR
jgi:dihydrofolate reductase